jgi:uncharacterized protein
MSDLEVFKKLNCPENVVRHCMAVSMNAVKIAKKVKIPIDLELVRKGGLFHDIGRCKTHDISHGVIGGEILRNLGMEERIVSIAERHIGAGIPEDEARVLGLPPKDYMPKTPEEKIVAYADNLTEGNNMIPFEEGLEKFKKTLGREHPAVKRFIALHEEIQRWIQ